MDCALTAVFDAKGLVGFWQRWSFDPMFTVTLARIADTDNDLVISEAENRATKTQAFDYLENYNYFTDLRINGQRVDRLVPERFRASFNAKGRMVYEFFTPCRVASVEGAQSVSIGVYDTTFYTDVAYAQTPLVLEGEHNLFDVSVKKLVLEDTKLEVMFTSPQGFELRIQPRSH
jgi:ABC-type uncharacterized transport system substrate-binding protein